MQVFIYNILIRLYILTAKFLALWKPKARSLVDGRKGSLERMRRDLKNMDRKQVVWFHCASLGEFEQGRPVMEAMKKADPAISIVLTFFSPSGYEVRKDHPGADIVCYLPFDTKYNAQTFIDIIRPDVAIFVKYDLWYHYLKVLKERGIPTLLIAAIFQERHAFFKWYGGLQRKMLHFLQHIFVQDQHSKLLLEGIGVRQVSIAGDTRIDRALTIAATDRRYPVIAAFKGESALVVAGSTWKDDEVLLLEALQLLAGHDLKLVIAPHEVHKEHIEYIKDEFSAFHPALFSEGPAPEHARVLIIDNIGHLAFLYRYADFIWIGGGFNKTGIHNSIEAAVYGKAMCWGPRYQRYREALDLVAAGAAVPCADGSGFASQVAYWSQHRSEKEKAGHMARQYISSNKGATEKITDHLIRQRIF